MKKSKSYKVKLMIEFPFECQVEASNEDEAIDIASDNAMDYLEDRTLGRNFNEFWEYIVKYQVLQIQENKN